MTLAAGTRLGYYEIVALLGAGGMGEVYRARDPKLQRNVALKILPSLTGLDSDRLARFRREAQVLAALNHPNIAAIYGFEDASDPPALVLELVEGATLAERLQEGPIPLQEALPIARQIAEALEAAHEQGIIHRDLKPANIKIRPDGTVKVLDFGLAKALEPVDAAASAALSSPTITSPALTRMGVILGTASYMSPEQAKGRAADKRSDVWAFGCVLYEMLTGRRTFEGDEVSETLASVLRSDPDWTALPRETPAPIRALLEGSLKRDRRDRIGDISTARFLLTQPAASTQPTPSTPPTGQVFWRRATLVALGVTIGAAAVASLWRPQHSISAPITRFAFALPQGPAFNPLRFGSPLLRRHLLEPLRQHVQVPRPAVLVPVAHLVVREVDVAQRDRGRPLARNERDRHQRLQAAGCFGDPRVFDRASPLEANEPAVVRPGSALVLHRVVEQPVDDGVDDGALDAEPESARALGIEPDIEHLVGGGADGAGDREVEGLHVVCPFCAKCASRRSRRSFQNRS